MSPGRCYFGCDEPIRHTLLELPPPYSGAPDLCEFHSKSWRTYRALLYRYPLDWPADFWPWVDKTRKDMEETPTTAPATETRPPDTEILASEAVVGYWYTVPSGEIERCVGQRSRGRGVQVGFVGIVDPGNDPEEVRWLQGRTSILVADEIEVAKLMNAMNDLRERQGTVGHTLSWAICPRNGLLCSVCEAPQRVTPHGASCENGHGGAPGTTAGLKFVEKPSVQHTNLSQTQALSSLVAAASDADGNLREYVTQPGTGMWERAPDLDLQAGGPAMTDTEVRELAESGEAYTRLQEKLASLTPDQLEKARAALDNLKGRTFPIVAGTLVDVADEIPLTSEEASEIVKEAGLDVREGISRGLEQLAARTAGRLSAGPSSVFHKSLHIDWRTPRPIFDAQVARWGSYWLDAAANAENKLCEYHLGPGSDVEDALSVDWASTPEIVQQYGRNIWLNHPYSPGEEPCKDPCTKKKCAERGYHIDTRIASSGEWMVYARNQALALEHGGVITCLTKRAGETGWWEEAILTQPEAAGAFVSGRVDPAGGPAAESMNATKYKAALWMELRWERLVVDITEIKGRVDFDRGGNDGSAGFPSVIVTYYRPT